MDLERRLALVKRNTQEILVESELEELLGTRKHPVAYFGLAITGRLHIGYYIPIVKISDFLRAGFRFKILFADIHGHLDDQKTPFDLLDLRMEYYMEAIRGMLESIGVDASRLEFVKGRDFELDPSYTLDMYRLAASFTFNRCRRAASEVVRFGEEPKLSGFIYPILQALDEEYLDVDAQYGGHDQRKIMAFAREALPKLGYSPRVEVMSPMLPGLTGEKMSASREESKIDLLDTEEEVSHKMSQAFCPAGEVEGNGVLTFARYVTMILKHDQREGLRVDRPERYGGDITYRTIAELERDFSDGELHPQDLKTSLARETSQMLEPVRKRLEAKMDQVKQAYPDPPGTSHR